MSWRRRSRRWWTTTSRRIIRVEPLKLLLTNCSNAKAGDQNESLEGDRGLLDPSELCARLCFQGWRGWLHCSIEKRPNSYQRGLSSCYFSLVRRCGCALYCGDQNKARGDSGWSS